MITQSIRTSKYTTTIDIPAQKLQTRAKFIQISKSPFSSKEQIITIPNDCYESEKQNKRFTLQTKTMIEELQQAYNEDVQALQDQIGSMKTTHEIQKLKLQNQLEYQRRQLELSRKQAEQSQSMLRNSRTQKESVVSQLQQQIKVKQNVVNSQSKQLQCLLTEVKELRKQVNQKNALLTSKFRDIQSDKDKKHNDQRKSLQHKLSSTITEKQSLKRQLQSQVQRVRTQSKRHLLQVQLLQRQNLSTKQQLIESKKHIQFQSHQINDYIKNLKHLQRQKALLQQNNSNLHQKIQQQNLHIQKLLEEMRQQTIYIEEMQLSAGRGQISAGNSLVYGNLFIEEELKIMTLKTQEYANLLHQRDTQLTQKQTQYLLKLKEIDTQKLNSKKTLDQLALSKQQVTNLNEQISSLKQAQQHLKTQLAAKIVQYNQLLSKPPEHYEVKIEKTIDKKDYIHQLETKNRQLQAVIQQIKENNQTYVEEIKKNVKQIMAAKARQQSLIKSNSELKEYISVKEKSLGWAVEREIMKDVQISQDNSLEKASRYKVYVKHANSQSESGGSHIEFSGIQGTKQISFSVESKLEKILQKSRPQLQE